MIQIYHNSRCSKSRECVAFIEQMGLEYEIIYYLHTVLTVDDLKLILEKLAVNPIDLVRKKEKIWIEKFRNLNLSQDEIIITMIENPILIERPIVINGNKAVIARPLDKIDLLFK